MSDDLNPAGILELGTGYFASRTLLAAVELGVFAALSQGPLPLETLRSRLGLHPRSARDFLDALVALHMLERDDAGLYANTAETAAFLDPVKPGYVGGILDMFSRRLFGFWNNLPEALRSGELQNEGKGGGPDMFSALYADPERLENFLCAMTGISLGAAHAMAHKFPWDRYTSVIDIGCAQGVVPVTLMGAHPHLSGGGFDLPAVKPIFERYVAKHGLSARCVFHPGSFFEDPLPKADVLIMGHILHDWGLPEKRALIAAAFSALPAGGALIVYDAVIDDARRTNAASLLMSLNMLIETTAGATYTGAEGRAWFAEAGFREVRTEPLLGTDAMTIGIK